MKTIAKKTVPSEVLLDISVIKLVIIRKSKIADYIERIREKIPDPEILYVNCYEQAINLIRNNAHQIFQVITPDFYIDTNKKANEFAQEVKNINSKSKIFCYSKENPKKTENLNLIKINYESAEEEIQVLIDLLK